VFMGVDMLRKRSPCDRCQGGALHWLRVGMLQIIWSSTGVEKSLSTYASRRVAWRFSETAGTFFEGYIKEISTTGQAVNKVTRSGGTVHVFATRGVSA